MQELFVTDELLWPRPQFFAIVGNCSNTELSHAKPLSRGASSSTDDDEEGVKVKTPEAGDGLCSPVRKSLLIWF